MAGRPSLYKPEFAKQAYKLCLLGATNATLADFFEVAVSTIDLWIAKHETFSGALKKGRLEADAVIAKSLYHRAKGYSHSEDKVFNNNGKALIVSTVRHYPPDTTACIFWLKNRQPARWRDKQDMEISGKDGGPVAIDRIEVVFVDPANRVSGGIPPALPSGSV